MGNDNSDDDSRLPTGECSSSAAQAALLSDLGTLRLEEGKVDDAAEYFRQALSLQPESHSEAARGESDAMPGEDEDDWERGWEQNLSQLTPQRTELSEQPTPSRSSAQSPEAPRRAALPRQPRLAAAARAENGRGAVDSGSDSDDVDLTYNGRHILEITGLTSATTTNDLEAFFSHLNAHALEPAVRWVNDKTALGVFADPAAALAALHAASDTRYKLRLFSQACEASKQLPNKELQPPRPRPKTSAAIAKRLIGMALNAPNLCDKAAEEQLRQQRKSNRELKKERQRQVDATWESD